MTGVAKCRLVGNKNTIVSKDVKGTVPEDCDETNIFAKAIPTILKNEINETMELPEDHYDVGMGLHVFALGGTLEGLKSLNFTKSCMVTHVDKSWGYYGSIRLARLTADYRGMYELFLLA